MSDSLLTFTFTDSLLWFTFDADSSGIAFVQMASKPDSTGAVLESFTLFQGGCGNLQSIFTLTYQSNDSLSVWIDSLNPSQTYWIVLERIIFNNCSVCNNEINLNISTNNTLDQWIACDISCASPIPLLNGGFDNGFTGYSTSYTIWTSGGTVGTYFIGNDAGTYVHQHFTGNGTPDGSPAFFMCDNWPNGATTFAIRNSTPLAGLQIGNTYIFSFWALNLDSKPGNANPTVVFAVNDVLLNACNVFGNPTRVTIPYDPGEWRRLLYYWECNSTTAVFTISQIRPPQVTSYGYDLGIDNIELLEVQQPPSLSVLGNSFCIGEDIDLGLVVHVSGGQAPFTYHWSNWPVTVSSGDPTNLVSPQTPTYYQLTVTDALGCQASIEVLANPLIPVEEFAIEGFANNCDLTTTYTADLQDPGYYYSWSIQPADAGDIQGSSAGYGIYTVSVLWNNSVFPDLPAFATLTCKISESYALGPPCWTESNLNIYKCCDYQGNSIPLTNHTIDSPTQYPAGTNFSINGVLEVMADFTINGPSTVAMGAMTAIRVHPGATLTVTGAVHFIHLCHPAYMWDGIYAGSPSAEVIFNSDASGNPDLAHAIAGIVSSHGGYLNIQNTNFLDNYNSIQIMNYYDGVPGYSGSLPIVVTGCDFSQPANVNPPYTHTLTINPLAGQLPNSAIWIKNIKGVDIGSSSAPANSFSFLQRGIWAENSEVTVKNANFTSMPAEDNILYSWPPKQAAILATGPVQESAIPIIPSLTVDGGTGRNVIIQDCYYGIACQRLKADISWLESNASNYPIHLMDLRFPTVIEKCNLHKDPSMTEYDMKGTGISVLNTFPTTAPDIVKLRIADNTIEGLGNGIHLIQQNSLFPLKQKENIIQDNVVWLQSAVKFESTRPRHGIWVEGCDGIKIMHNLLIGYWWSQPSSTEDRGIRICRSPASWVSHNDCLWLHSGIYTNGDLFNTQFPCNYFMHCNSGFFFGPGTAMSDQHIPYSDPLNPLDYYCPNNQFGIGFSSSTNNLRLRQDEAKENIVNVFNWFYKDDPNQPGFLLDEDHMALFWIHPCYPDITPLVDNDAFSVCDYVESLGDSVAIDSIIREFLYGEYARSSINYDSLLAQYRFYEKDYLYTVLLHNPDLIQMNSPTDSLYADLIDSLNNEDPGLIQKVYDFIRNNELDSASYYNGLISASTSWVENRKNANALYLQTWAEGDFNISSSDSVSAAYIAVQTPYKAGDGVYTYRVLLNMLDPEFYGTPYKAPVQMGSPGQLKVSPNPCRGRFSVELQSEPEGPVEIGLYSVTGERLRYWRFRNAGKVVDLDASPIADGIYLVRAATSHENLGYAKICIIR